eukprot:Phypoly_transcript_11438.p1 GENE.Phypoly_transcript_11438~~Phypoly_transcript_11438.p1  ORF type:complete len:361 (+),score=43.57 Phypoly_transcript_11438:40-1122(+)
MPKRVSKKRKLADNTIIPQIHSIWTSHAFSHILTFLDPLDVYLKYSKVCKQWRNVSVGNEWWFSLCLRTWKSEQDKNLIAIQKEKGGLTDARIYFSHPWWEWRYFNGEPEKENKQVFREVWNEMEEVKLSTLSNRLKNQMEAVIVETMTRIKTNVELLDTRLKKMNYPIDFLIQSAKQSDIEAAEKKIGNEIPIVLKYFWNMIGEIDFCRAGAFLKRFSFWENLSGSNKWSDNALIVNPPQHQFIISYIGEGGNDTNMFLMSEDSTAKNNVSGGYFEISLMPTDSLKLMVWGETDLEKRKKKIPEGADYSYLYPSFIEMLRQSLEFAGFPGFTPLLNEQSPELDKILAVINDLSKDLLLF